MLRTLAFACLIAIVGCDDEPAASCTSGETNICNCTPSLQGIQLCRDGAFGICTCEGFDSGVDVGGGDVGGDDAAVRDGSVDSGTLEDGPITTLWVGDYTNCGKRESGTVVCWGGRAELFGFGETETGTPIEVPAFVDAQQIAFGVNHACVLHADGRVECAGENIRGQLGRGDTENSLEYSPVTGIADAVQIESASGIGHPYFRRRAQGHRI